MWLFIIGAILVVLAVAVIAVVGAYIRNCKKEGKKPFEEELELEIKKVRAASDELGRIKGERESLMRTIERLTLEKEKKEVEIAAAARSLNKWQVQIETERLKGEESSRKWREGIEGLKAEEEEERKKLEGVKGEREEVIKEIEEKKKEVEGRLAEINLSIQAKANELEALLGELNEKKERYTKVVMEESKSERDWWTLEVSPQEEEMVALLRKLGTEYPLIREELAKVEWSKVWLPRLQELGGREGLRGCAGIYRLVLKSDEKVCYVGQAVDLLDRWYTHVKKMVGAEKKGNERVYKYKPEDFWWTVIERVEDKEKLDEKEKWWIEFYGAKEVGLNKKI